MRPCRVAGLTVGHPFRSAESDRVAPLCGRKTKGLQGEHYPQTPIMHSIFRRPNMTVLLLTVYNFAVSTARATRNAVPSFMCAASTCMPTGRPALVVPQGTETPQIPAKLAVTV